MSVNDVDNDNERPKTPLEEDCCGSGCTPCVFDVHKTLLKEWENRKLQRVKIKPNTNLLSLLSYKTFVITDISIISEEYFLIYLEYPESKIDNNGSLHLVPGQYVMLHSWYKSRPYTPIAWTHKSLVFLIKTYKWGEFSTRLTNASVGNTIDVRGPYGDFKYKNNSFQQVVMFSIGSGIAAVYPVARAIINDETEQTRVHLVAGFQSIAQVPLKKELRQLVDYWNFKCTLQLSQPNDKTASLHGFDIRTGRLSKLCITDYLGSKDTKATLILICGTSKFNQSMREWIEEMNYRHIYVFD